MDKENTIQMFQESLTQEEKRLVAILAITATEGISINTVYQVLKPSSPNKFRLSVESLGRRNWFSLVHQTIEISPQMADLILETAPIDQQTIETVLWEIYEYLALRPLDVYSSIILPFTKPRSMSQGNYSGRLLLARDTIRRAQTV